MALHGEKMNLEKNKNREKMQVVILTGSLHKLDEIVKLSTIFLQFVEVWVYQSKLARDNNWSTTTNLKYNSFWLQGKKLSNL